MFTHRKIMTHTECKKNNTVTKAKIRVIKKSEMGSVEMLNPVDKLPKKEAAREMVATVMSWVSDFETRKIEESRLATERFQEM